MSYLKRDGSSNPLMMAAVQSLIAKQQQAEADDAVELARRAGIAPDDWQRDVLRSQARQMILLCSRQSGKSTVTSLLALHQAIYTPASLVLILAPALRQSQELFRKLKAAFNAIRGELVAPVIEESALRLEFANASRIVCLPGKEATIRGFSDVSLLVVDEASRVMDGLYNAIRPMLAVSRGRIALLSTPFGRRGFFWNEWENGGSAWHRAKVTAYDCPRISNEWLEAERRTVGDWWFSQEYLCEFLDSVDQVFSSEDIARAMDHSIEPLFASGVFV